MEYNYLGKTDLKVSKICLGTMTWGQQNTELEGHEQLDYAIGRDINFIDTAEMYSVPANPNTYGSTEKIIGTWINKRKNRSEIVLATKAAGKAEWLKHIRNTPNFSKKQLTEALENSLKRLQTDYIDLYQLHWPERPTNFFGVLDYIHKSEDIGTPFEEILETLQSFIGEGKIRHFGISNETPYGMHQYLLQAEKRDLPRVVSIQNPYSLINRTFEIGLSEMAIREKVGLLAYSPLAFGVLSGKYLNGQKPENARITLFPNFSRYNDELSTKATQRYVDLALSHGLTPTQMALAFVNQRDFVTSNIIGATTMAQLKENIDSIDIKLSESILKEIDIIHHQIPNPAP